MTTARRPPHRDHSRPIPRAPVPDPTEVDELAATVDDDLYAEPHTPTPVEAIEERIRGAIVDHAELGPEWAPLVDAIVVEVAQRTAEQRAMQLAAADGMPRRLREAEAALAELAVWRRKLTGEADTNGRIGRIEQRIAESPAQRAEEVRTIAAVRWSTAKLLVIIGLGAASVGGGIVTAIRARAAIERAEGRIEQHEIDQDRRLDRLERTP